MPNCALYKIGMNPIHQDGPIRYAIPLIVFLLMLGLLSANLGNSFRTSKELFQAAQIVDHTRAVRDSLFRLQTDYFDGETGQRGYLLTGNRSYLTPYLTARARVGSDLDSAALVTADDPILQLRLTAIRGIVNDQFNELARTIYLYDHNNAQGAIALVKTNLAATDTAEFRSQITEMRAESANQMGVAQATELKRVKNAETVNIANSLMIFLVVMVLVLGYYTRMEAEVFNDPPAQSSS